MRSLTDHDLVQLKLRAAELHGKLEYGFGSSSFYIQLAAKWVTDIARPEVVIALVEEVERARARILEESK